MFLLINLERPGYWKSNYFMNVNMTFEEYLDIYGKMTYRNVGVSMLPMLKQDRDLFTVEKKQKKDAKSMMWFCIDVRRISMYFIEL